MKVLRKGFKQPLNPVVSKFISSARDDQALIDCDIAGSIAHTKMLHSCGLISDQITHHLIHGLKQVKQYYQENNYELDEQFEDVHMNVEVKLKEFIGSDADYLHTARSRNDQVALDMRLFVSREAKKLKTALESLKESILEKASSSKNLAMPGYTHLQKAQPLAVPLVLDSFCEMFSRDQMRLDDVIKRTETSPLGAAALAGTSLPIDVNHTASELQFPAVYSNSLDAISDRDFVMDFLYACTTIGVHLSQVAETLILWFTKEFDFISLPDNLTTASSIMPQKKNPDGIELIRSKAGAPIGELVNVVTILKGLPQGYNRDLQDTKPGIIHVSKTMNQAIEVMAITFEHLQFNETKLEDSVSDAGLYATDLLEYLVKKGVPNRQAHEIVSTLAKTYSNIDKIPLDEFKKHSESFEQDLYSCFDSKTSIASKIS